MWDSAVKQSKAERDVLARIGGTLIQVQRTELMINFWIKHVMPKRAKPSKDMFEPKGKRPPLGRLIAELHRHVAVPKPFEATLKEFLDKRNALVHQIEFIPNWTLQHERGLIAANAFLDRLDALERKVRNVFDALLKAWNLEHGGAGQEGCLRPISDKAYLHLAKSLSPER